jgi:lipopolysaccharide export system protein LptA
MRFPIFLFVLCSITLPSWAQTTNTPVEIKANDALEWNSQKQQYIARGNASAVQEGSSITADELTAEYKDMGNGKTEISMMTANGNVIVTKDDMTGTSERAVYDMGTELITMSGGNLRLATKDKIITARDRFEYHMAQGLLKAIGNAVIIAGDKQLKADRVDAVMDKNNQLQSAEAIGSVVITTPKEQAKSSRATYDARTNIVKLFDNVVITQGQNTITGARAEVNLNTNVSHMFGNEKSGGRVKAVFFPQK